MVVFVLCLALSLTLGAHGYVSVPGIFSDGMVLQEHSTYDQRPMIYGQATQPGELVTVIRHLPSGHNDTYYATADATSFWIVQLDPDYFSKSQNNLTIYITGSVPPLNTITIRDVVYGDVFLCSGCVQSLFSLGNASYFILVSFKGSAYIRGTSHQPHPTHWSYHALAYINNHTSPCFHTLVDRVI